MRNLKDFSTIFKSDVIYEPIKKLSMYDTQDDIYDTLDLRKSSIDHIPTGNSFFEIINEIRGMLHKMILTTSELKGNLHTAAGGDNMSEEIVQKLHSVDVRLTRTETLVEQISIKLDKMDAKIDTLATKDFVEKIVSKSETSTMRWIIGTGVGVAALVISIIKLF